MIEMKRYGHLQVQLSVPVLTRDESVFDDELRNEELTSVNTSFFSCLLLVTYTSRLWFLPGEKTRR